MTIDNIFKIISLLIQVITTAMKAVENVMEKGSGKTKKEIVMMLAKDALGDAMYAQFETLISIFINIKALLTFGSSGDDPV
jgi:hypothetical protein